MSDGFLTPRDLPNPPYRFHDAPLGNGSAIQSALKAANARYAAMTPDQQKAMWQAQRESFIRGMTTPCEHGVLDFESCGECRA